MLNYACLRLHCLLPSSKSYTIHRQSINVIARVTTTTTKNRVLIYCQAVEVDHQFVLTIPFRMPVFKCFDFDFEIKPMTMTLAVCLILWTKRQRISDTRLVQCILDNRFKKGMLMMLSK